MNFQPFESLLSRVTVTGETGVTVILDVIIAKNTMKKLELYKKKC